MIRIVSIFLGVLCCATAFAQDIQSAVATRMLYFDNNALVDTSAEQLTPLSYGGVGVFSGSMKYTAQYDGTFYQTFYGNNRIFFRKSSDGINWSNALTVTDTSVVGFVNYHPNIAVWSSAGDVQVAMTYIDQTTTPVQLAFVKSSDGGDTFGTPVHVSNHTDSDGIMNCGFSCKGDTLLATWTRRSGDYWERNWESHSVDGGLTWSPQQQVSSGWQYSFIGDSDIDADGNFYSVLCADLGWRVELVTAKSTDLGQTWQQTTQPTNLGSPNTTTNAQIMVEDSIVFISATHSLNYLDYANVHRSEDFGQTWATVPVSDSDSLQVSNIGGGTNLFCHTSIAKGGGQRLYMAWSDSRGYNQYDYTLCDYYVYISWSDDNGLTWSPNYRVSTPSNYATTTNVYCSLSVIPGITGDEVLVSWTKNRDVSLLQVPGCTASEACNYNPEATIEDGSCELPGSPCDDGNEATMFDMLTADCQCAGELMGCSDLNACNYTNGATIDDGSCIFPGDVCDDGDSNTLNDQIQPDCSCAGEIPEVLGCTDNTACNYNVEANSDDGSCLHVGDTCDDGNASTENDVITAACECVGTAVNVEEWQQHFSYFPNPATDFVRVLSHTAQNIEEIEIRDLQGRILMNVNMYAQPAVINVSSLATARYILMIKTANSVHAVPLAIVHN
jgi:hypothetical protein